MVRFILIWTFLTNYDITRAVSLCVETCTENKKVFMETTTSCYNSDDRFNQISGPDNNVKIINFIKNKFRTSELKL